MQQWWKVKGDEPKPVNPNDTDHGIVGITLLAMIGGLAGMHTLKTYVLPSLTKFQYDCIVGGIATLFYIGYEIFYGRKILQGNVLKRLICYCIMGFGLGFFATNAGGRGRDYYNPKINGERALWGTVMFIFPVWFGGFYWKIFSKKKGVKENE